MSQTNLTTLKKIIHFPVIKMLIGIATVAGSVALIEWAGRSLLDKTRFSDELKNLVLAIVESVVAAYVYFTLFKLYEQRPITELSRKSFFKHASRGFSSGFLLQTLFIFILHLAGGYHVTAINPVSFLLPAFTTALSAGFVAEILIRGIAFRLTEESLGTPISVLIFAVLFALFHLNAPGATIFSVIATALQAGLLLSSAYVLTRSLWFPIFLHFAWDFTEPGIYGAINPGNSVTESFISSVVGGPVSLSGGEMGPQNSMQSIIICLATSLLFLWIAKRKNNFIRPFWNRNA